MRILFVMRSAVFTNLGGAELQVDYLCRLCEDAGFEVHHAFDAAVPPAAGDRRVTYHLLPDRGGRPFCWLNAGRLDRLVAAVRPDVVYQRTRFAYTGLVARAARRHGVPFLYNAASLSDCCRNRVPLTPAFLLNGVNEWLGRVGIARAHTIVCQTEEQQVLLRRNFGRAGVRLPTLAPVPAPPFPKAAPPVVLWMASVKPVKQPGLFLDLADACRQLDARFVMAGRLGLGRRGDAEFLSRVAATPNLEYLGELPFEQTAAWFARSTVLVNTSQWRESFPNTYVQAWLHETPVVALDCDPDGVLERERIGTRAGYAAGLVRAVSRLCRAPAEAAVMGARARRYAVDVHALEKAGPAYLELFRRVAGCA
jgi:glycosyltransferase involved in cell wall biosynthesis